MARVQEFVVARNSSVASGSPEDIIVGGGTYTFPTAARIHDIESTSLLDNAAGTGANLILIRGLDSNFDRQEELVIPDGTTKVPTVNAYIRVNRFLISAAGILGSGAGVITATAQVDGTVTSRIAIGDGNALQAIFTVPDSEFAYQGLFYAGMIIMNASQNTALVRVLVRPPGTIFQTGVLIPLMARATSFVIRDFSFPFEIPARSDIKMNVEVSTSNTDISAGFDLRLQAP